MADPIIRLGVYAVIVDGKILSRDGARIVRKNLAEWVGQLADEGVPKVQEKIRTKHGTGFTAAAVEAKHDTNSLFATVRMKPDLVREPGTPGWPAKRRAYVINAVLASGIYRGERNPKRSRLEQWNRAAYSLRAKAKNIPTSLLLRGL